MKQVFFAISILLVPGLSQACVISTYEPGYTVPAATFGSDCSFTVPGQTTHYTDTSGKAPVDIGGGRIGQRVTAGFGCGWDEEIWIVDCNSGEMIGIRGPEAAEDMNLSRRAALLYPPSGALRLSADTTVPDIAAVAVREGYDHWTDFSARLSQISGQDTPNPACGCAFFYPDSALAIR